MAEPIEMPILFSRVGYARNNVLNRGKSLLRGTYWVLSHWVMPGHLSVDIQILS